MSVPDRLRGEMKRVVECATAWWMDRLVERLSGEMKPMYKARKETYQGNEPGWEKEFREDLQNLLWDVAGRMRSKHKYERDPQIGSKLRRIGLPKDFCPFSDEMHSLLKSYDLSPEDVGWPKDGVMCLNPFLIYIRYREDDSSETIYRQPFDLTQCPSA